MIHVPLINSSSIKQVIPLVVTIVLGNLIAYNVVNLPSQQQAVILFTVLFFYPVLRHPVVGLFLYFSVMPCIPYLRRLYYLQYSRPEMDPLIMTGDILTGFIVLALFFTFRESRENGEFSHPMNRIVIIYLLYLVARTFILNMLPLPEAVARFRFYGPAVLLFFIGIIFSRDPGLLKRIWALTVLIGTIAALCGICQSIFGFSKAEKIWFNTISFTSLFIKGVARPFSIFQSPAAFADYGILSIIGIIILLYTEKNILKYLMIVLFPVLVYSILITSVRSSWIGVVIVFALWIIIFMLKNSKYRLLAIVVFSVLFAVLHSVDLYLDDSLKNGAFVAFLGSKLNPQYLDLMVTNRMGGIANPFAEHSLMSRFALWRYLIILCADPVMALLGRGVGALNSDSLYFTYLAEFGFPGMIFIILLYFYYIKKGFSLFKKTENQDETAIIKGITIMNIAFAVMNLTGTHIHSFPGDAFFWFWNGVLIRIATTREKQNETTDNP